MEPKKAKTKEEEIYAQQLALLQALQQKNKALAIVEAMNTEIAHREGIIAALQFVEPPKPEGDNNVE